MHGRGRLLGLDPLAVAAVAAAGRATGRTVVADAAARRRGRGAGDPDLLPADGTRCSTCSPSSTDRRRRPSLHRDDLTDSAPRRGRPAGPLRIGIGGPVGGGKTALVAALCRALRDRAVDWRW